MSSAPIAPDEGSKRPQGAKDDFVGTVKGSYVNHDCEACKNDGLVDYLMDNQGLSKEEAEEQAESDFDHFMEIEPLTEYEDTLHVLNLDLPASGSFESKWMVMMGYLHQIHGNLRTEHGVGENADSTEEELEDIAEFITGRTYKFHDVTWTEDEPHPFHDFNSQADMTLADIGDNSSNEMKPLTVPVEEVDPAEYGGEEDTGEVEEVDLE